MTPNTRPAHYRPALDGVRAFAVLAVIAYHTGSRVHGGFLGVDVFFVLSGYLITSLLLRERSRTHRIRLGHFWANRLRRLLPALLLVVLVTAIVVAASASSTELAGRRADMFSTLFYFANWHLIDTGQSYFAGFVGVSPLRHTWSLAIEEQFYLLWPLILIAITFCIPRWRRVLPWIIGGVAVVSAVLMALRYDPLDPARAYYGTDTRVHQLLIGALFASIVQLHPSTLVWPKRLAAVVASVAAVIVLVAFFTVGDQDASYYRGGAFLFAIVVAGGLWALEACPSIIPAKLLSLAPFVWIGTISYGVYLWHWPLIVWIGDAERFASWTATERTVLEVALTFAIAAASFYVIERPIRYRTVPWLTRSGWRLAAIGLVCTVIVAGFVVRSTHISASSIAAQVTDTSDSECPAGSPSTGLYAFCARTKATHPGAPTVAVVGDSTSRALDPGMRAAARARGWRYVQAGVNGCSLTPAYLVGSTDPTELRIKADCPKYMPQLLRDVADRFRPDVWIVSDWNLQAQLVTDDGSLLDPIDPRRLPILVASLRSTLRAMTADGSQVVYLETPPTAEPVDCATGDRAAACDSPAHSVSDASTAMINRIVRRAATGIPGVTFVPITDVLCNAKGRCPAEVDGQLARYDGVHYTSAFSRRIVRLVLARAEHAGVRFTAPSSAATAA